MFKYDTLYAPRIPRIYRLRRSLRRASSEADSNLGTMKHYAYSQGIGVQEYF